jgi:hypothetical protein
VHTLRQGDPQSLLLFVIVIEALGVMKFAVMSQGLLSYFFVGTRILVGLISLTFCLFMLLSFFVGLTQNIYVICGAYSYVLKLFWA